EAALCAAPLLFLLAAVGSFAAARFAAPTAVLVAATAFVLFAGRGLVLDGARYIVHAAESPRSTDAHDHDAPPEFSSGRVALAKAAVAAFSVVPRLETFDRTDDLVLRRATTWGDLGRAALE